MSRAEKAWLFGVFAATVVVMWATHDAIGHVRDEGYYFKAARRYQGWFQLVGQEWGAGRFLAPFAKDAIAEHWEYNHEHPPVAKVAFALSHLLFREKLGWMNDTTAFRVPAFLFSGLLSAALFLLARPWGKATAVLAPAMFWLVPRHFFHGHIACFDIPITALWLLFVWAAARPLALGRGAAWAGLAFGLALSTKHNAFFLPIVIVLHWLVTDRTDLRADGFRHAASRIPSSLWAMALIGPLVLYVSWPWLWHQPVSQVAWWMRFHANHVHYPWQYFGELLRAPPFPALYPLALEAVTLPATTLVATGVGALLCLPRGAGSFSAAVRRRFGELDRYEWLLALAAFVALAPFLSTQTPIFGGIKHWMAAIALTCIPAAHLVVRSAGELWPKRRLFATASLASVVLVPAAVQVKRFHPWGTSAYNELAGGAPGAASLGMQRQYWSNNVTAVLPWLNENAPKNSSVFLHEVNFESYRAYVQNGRLRRDLRYTQSPRNASFAAYQYHQEFRSDEFEIWTEFGTRSPLQTFAVDEAPQVVLYGR